MRFRFFFLIIFWFSPSDSMSSLGAARSFSIRLLEVALSYRKSELTISLGRDNFTGQKSLFIDIMHRCSIFKFPPVKDD